MQTVTDKQVKAGLLANSIGLGNMVITNPLDVKVRLKTRLY